MNKLTKYIGNKKIIDKLISNYHKKSLSNSIILYGPKGIGKSTMSFFFIKNIFQKLLDNRDSNDINLLYNYSHPNIKYIEKIFDQKTDKVKSFITIDQIRNLQNFLNQSPLNNLPKFVIIDSINDLNLNSANSLLKSLEEPKKNTYFILIAHQLSNILPTIRSRCIKFHIENPNFDQYSDILKNFQLNLSKEKINFLYYISNASPGLSLDLCEDKIDNLYNNILNILIRNIPLSLDIINFSNLLGKLNNDEFRIFIFLFRFVLISIIKINVGYYIFDDIDSKLLKNIEEVAKIINNNVTLKMLEYLNTNENDLFIYNLDKKIFTLNIFAILGNFNE